MRRLAACKSVVPNNSIEPSSIEIKRGMIYGLIGENGAGKSTFMRTIMG
ncbi:hypothetical protein BXA50_17315, partial [Enterococcus faecium]